MCEVLVVRKSGYYKWLVRTPSKRTLFNAMLIRKTKQIHWKSKGRYGSPRIAKELNMQGIKASEPLVARLMREEHIRSIIRKKYVVTTDSKHKYPVAENKLMQQFNVKQKNEV